MQQDELDSRRMPAIWFRRYAGRASSSKLGGLPALPPRRKWPRHGLTRTPLHFLAQIDLSQLPPTPLEDAPNAAVLPRRGFLFFFADMVEEMLWDQNGGPLATTRVIFADRMGAERPPPDDIPDIGHPFGEVSSRYNKGNKTFTQAALEPHVIETFAGIDPFPHPDDPYPPTAQAAMVASIGRALGAPLPVFSGRDSFAAVATEKPLEYVQEFHMRDGDVRRDLHCPRHQMLGAPKNIQGTGESRYEDGTILLLQIDSDFAVHRKFIFCDMGVAQFWIRPADLAAARFDRAWATTEGG